MIGRHAPRMVEGTSRIAVGLVKKFVIADSLALFSLNATNAAQPTNTLGVWILLYTYTFRLFLDFSGYSDIAIGIGILFGIKLPENFDRPYVKNNIAAFWQSWHMTLSSWARFYVFSPLSRALLRRPSRPSNEIIMFICHMSTMLVIGLWHGVTLTFVLWAAWHGLGLWLHKLWTDRTRKWYISLRERPRVKFVWTVAGVLITFHFVVLSWVWFALPDVDSALSVFSKLFGGGS
jgi:alginate O-acetyltransferase complex protein AlgI